MIEALLDKALMPLDYNANGIGRSDFDLNPAFRPTEDTVLRRAAVLVPIVNHRSGPTVLLTKRTEHLRSHAGQVSFPGGKIDDNDSGPIAAALRETREEIGLGTDYIDVRGRLETYQTSTGFAVTPIVAIVKPGFTLTLEECEVEEAFECPLAFLRDRNNHQKRSGVWKGIERHYYAMPYNGFYIWGATAGMIVNLCDHLDNAETQSPNR